MIIIDYCHSDATESHIMAVNNNVLINKSMQSIVVMVMKYGRCGSPILYFSDMGLTYENRIANASAVGTLLEKRAS